MERISQILPRVLDQILKTSKARSNNKLGMPEIRTETDQGSIIMLKTYSGKAK